MVNKKPTVSVIIPTYNRASLLPRTIKSVLNQTYQDFELIVVDDCSSDNTEEVARSFKDKRIKYIKHDKNEGSAATRNTGIKVARGKYMAFLDSDDEWLPEKLEKQLGLFAKNSRLEFVSCNAYIIDEKQDKKVEYKIPKSNNYFLSLLETNIICSSSSVMVKKDVLDDVGYFDENLKTAQDWDMWIKIAQRYDFDFVPEPLFEYYIHKDNITKLTPFQYKIKDLNNIFEKYKQYYYEHPKLYSSKLRYDGTRCILNRKLEEGRRCFLKSIKFNPLNLKSYLYLLLSFGGVNFYYNLSLIKARIRGFKIFRRI